MPRGPIKEAIEINGWMMKKKKPIPTFDEMIYHCVERETRIRCPAAYGIHNISKDVRIIQEHMNHEINILSNKTRLARQELKRRAELGTPREVIDGIRADFGPEASICIGNYNAKRRMLHFAKSKEDPDTRLMDEGGPISGKFQISLDGSPFVICDLVTPQGRMAMFASDRGLELLSTSNVVMVDGTFACVPNGFVQLFTFHVYVTTSVVRPVVYCLLPNKQLATYEGMLDVLLALPLLSHWQPELVIADFELNIKTAFENKLPSCEIHGCLFHLIQSWRRQSEKLGLYEEFIKGSLQNFWQLLKVLPFIDDLNIPHYFAIICDDIQPLATQQLHQKLLAFVEYVDRNYVNGFQTTAPRFPPKLWSCAVQTVNSINRTTNTVECWHRLLQTVVSLHNGFSRIKLSDLLTKLRSEDRHTNQDVDELRLNPNFQVVKNRTVYNMRKDRRLLAAVENNPLPPNQPLVDMQLLLSFVHSKRN